MILGFAHITKNLRSGALQSPPYPSSSGKWPLMMQHATSHRLLVSSPRFGTAVELVEYDTGVIEKPGRLGSFGTDIAMRVHDRDKEYRFFVPGLGFSAELGKLYLASTIEHWRVRVHTWVDPDPYCPIDPPLDIAGYAALAFYSSDVEADRDHLLQHGGRTPTEPFTVKLDREMKIVMLRSPEGTIIELIQVIP